MTTLAYDGITLAADSQITQGDHIAGYQNKIVWVEGGILACCGNTECGVVAQEWFNKGCPQDDKPTLERFRAIYIPDTGGHALEFNERLIPERAFIPWAAGTGNIWALSAMKLGRDAVAAVEFAIGMDVYSGGAINSVVINKQESK